MAGTHQCKISNLLEDQVYWPEPLPALKCCVSMKIQVAGMDPMVTSILSLTFDMITLIHSDFAAALSMLVVEGDAFLIY